MFASHETGNTFQLLESSLQVTIYVILASNTPPVFNPSVVNITVSESAPVSVLLTLAQISYHNALNISAPLRSDIVSGNEDNVFRLVTSPVGSSGTFSVQLGLNAALDFESTASHSLVVRVFTATVPPRTADLPVSVTVTDWNDNAPRFNASVYVARIPENAAIGQFVTQVFADDADSAANGRIAFSIDSVQSIGGDAFRIDQNTGVITVGRLLSASVRRSYPLVVVARDGGTVAQQSTVVVSIEVTRSIIAEPVLQVLFLSDDGSASILKSAASGDFVAQISVADPNNPDPSAVTMTLIGGNRHFALRSTGTTVYLMVVASSLDDAPSSYQMSVVATVGDKSVAYNFTLTVVSDTSSSAGPRFSQHSYYGEIQEVAPPGTSVLQVSVIGGTSGVEYVYRIRGRSGSRFEWFTIDKSSGLITTSATFDCLTVGDYRFNVTASEAAAPRSIVIRTTVIVRVSSVSRHPPYFAKPFYTAHVDENSLPDTCVLQVSRLFVLNYM